MNLIDFNNAEPSGIYYGGHSGNKKGIIYNNERWFLKYPKSTKDMDVKNLSYTTSPLSEYIASQIYNSIGIDVHQTLLGIANNKVVVACKDFLRDSETIQDYNMIRNNYDEKIVDKLDEMDSSSSLTIDDIDELLVIMNEYPELKERFWDMFIVDALLGNNDRNESNWGIILDKSTGNKRLAPVYDNGSSFNTKSSNEKLEDIYNDEFKFKQSVYENVVSAFGKNDKRINPLKYIEQSDNKDLFGSINKIIPKIDLEKIKDIIYSIPTYSENGIEVCSDIQKKFYYKSIEYRLENVLIPKYKKIEKLSKSKEQNRDER